MTKPAVTAGSLLQVGEAGLDRAQDRLVALGDARRLRRHHRRGARHAEAADRVDRVGRGQAEDRDQDAAEARPRHRGQLVEAVGERDRGREALVGDGAGDGRRAGHALDRRGARHRRGEDEEDPDRRRAERRGDRQGGGDRDQGELAEEQQPTAVDAVGEGAAEERGDDQRAELGGADQADEEGRAGDHEHLVGERDQGRLGTEAGDQRARREQAKIPRLAQGLDVDRYTG